MTGACHNMFSKLQILRKKKTKTGLDTQRWEKRLQKEVFGLARDPPPGISLGGVPEGGQSQGGVDIDDLGCWTVTVEGPRGSIYQGEEFTLRFRFGNKYPFDSPEVMFVGSSIPVHPHVYSNGHICLSILTEDWSPAMGVEAICLSIASMLSSCKEKKRPPDNSFYIKTCHKNPKKTRWWYHDENI